MKTKRKIKQLVKVRERVLSNGDVKFYLDINQKGKKRITETLDFVWVNNPKNMDEKRSNDKVREAVNIIRARREEELLSSKYKLTLHLKTDTLLLEYTKLLMEERKDSKGNYGNWDSMYKHLKRFLNYKDITIGSISKQWVKDFREFLKKDCKIKTASSSSYFNKILALFKQAVKDKIIYENPAEGVEGIVPIKTMRSFLNEEEVKFLSQADCRYEVLKRAFLFSTITGLRWSDVVELRWKNIDIDFDKMSLRGMQEKTEEFYGIPLSDDAKQLLGERSHPDEKVFVGLKYSSYMNVAISKWCLNAGITKPITFHSARHTYAYLLLKQNVNIYTISKLLGHSHVKTTEKYLHLLDMDKREAVEKLPKLNFALGFPPQPKGIQYSTKRLN